MRKHNMQSLLWTRWGITRAQREMRVGMKEVAKVPLPPFLHPKGEQRWTGLFLPSPTDGISTTPPPSWNLEPSSTLPNQAITTAGSSSQMPQTLTHSFSGPVVQTLPAHPDLASLLLCRWGCTQSARDSLCSETRDGPPLRIQAIEQTSDLHDYTPISGTAPSLSTLNSSVPECSQTRLRLCPHTMCGHTFPWLCTVKSLFLVPRMPSSSWLVKITIVFQLLAQVHCL